VRLFSNNDFAYVKALLKNVWKNHYSQPLNSTLGGLHMTQTTHDFVEWANPTRNSPKWSCGGRQQWFKKFMLEMPLNMVKIIHSTCSNNLGGFS
jgi:hypothetical protein